MKTDKHIDHMKKFIVEILDQFVWFIRFVRRFAHYCRAPLKLDIHASEHCNLKCSGCTHFSPLAKPEFCDLEQLDKSLAKLSQFEKKIGAVQLLGGEPLLNPDICRMMEIARKHFGRTQINLLTNGILLLSSKLPADFWEVCRENKIVIRVTIYPATRPLLEKLDAICREHNVTFELFADRTEAARGWTHFPLYKNGKGYWFYEFKWFKLWKCGSLNCFQLVDDRIYACSHSAYARHLNTFFGTDFRHCDKDYLEVEKIRSVWQFRKLLLFATPFCQRYCGRGYQPARWKVSDCDPKEWIADF